MRLPFRHVAVAACAAAALAIPAAGLADAVRGPVLKWSPTTSAGTYTYGTVDAGHSASKTFRLTNSGTAATGALTITLKGSRLFTTTADTCRRATLKAHESCHVTIRFAPTTAGLHDSATLEATSSRPAASAKLTLQGASRKATPAIATSPSAGGTAGATTVKDTAVLSGGGNPGGTIEFSLHGPSATANCSGTAVDTESVTVSGNGSYTTPNGFTTFKAGTYWWTVSYSGDSNNHPASSKCGKESVNLSLSTAPHLYWTDNTDGTIVEANLDGSNAEAIVTGQNGPEGVAVSGSNLYWADNAAGTIMEANLDGSNPQAIVTGQNGPTGVAVNGSNLYWADAGAGTIMEANLDGSNPQAIVTGQNPIAGVAVNGSNLYWAAGISIWEANLDGTNPQGIILVGIDVFLGGGVAANSSNLYWTEAFPLIRTSDVFEGSLTGNSAKFIVSVTGSSAPHLIGLALTSSNLYWADNTDGTINEAGLDGTNPHAIATDSNGPMYVAVGPQ